MAHDHIRVFFSEPGARSRRDSTSLQDPQSALRSHRNGTGAGCRGLIREDHERWHPGDYRFGRTLGTHARGRTAFSRVNGFLKSLIEAVANAKVRRMQRELELRGIRYDPANNRWVISKSQPAERSR